MPRTCRSRMTSCFSRGLLHRVVRSFSGYDIAYVYYDVVVTNDEWVKPVYLNPCRVVCGESSAYSNLIFYSFGLKIMDLVVVFELYGFLSNDVSCDEVFEQVPQFCNVRIVPHSDGAPCRLGAK